MLPECAFFMLSYFYSQILLSYSLVEKQKNFLKFKCGTFSPRSPKSCILLAVTCSRAPHIEGYPTLAPLDNVSALCQTS